jgi:hypothetical protein
MLQGERPTSPGSAYARGTPVKIVGGVHRGWGYTGVVCGETRYYVDVYVPRVQRQLRVRKTSVQIEVAAWSENAGKAGRELPQVELPEKTERAMPQVIYDLMLVCGKLAQLGTPQDDALIHALVDAALMIAREHQMEEKKCSQRQREQRDRGKRL